MGISNQSPKLRQQNGFTLIELMVVVGLVAIIAALATPSWNQMIVSNRIRAAVNDWTLSTYFARNEAVRQNVPVTMCPSSDGVTCTASDYETGWIVKTQIPTDNTGTILQDNLPKSRVTMVVTPQTKRAITFLPNGMLIGSYTGALLTVRDFPATDATLSKYVCIPRTGRIKVYTDAQFMALPATACGS